MKSCRKTGPESPRQLRALITGASGFIGKAVSKALMAIGWQVVGQVCRRPPLDGVIPLYLDLLPLPDDFGGDYDAVIHLAAITHPPAGKSEENDLWDINVGATAKLARAAARQKAHFVFVSTAKVMGESGIWNDSLDPSPQDNYAHSKLAAEIEISRINDLDFTILRPPLVYGPGVQSNFLSILHWADTGCPLPLASLSNQRSLLYVENLADAILNCLQHRDRSFRKTWLLSDGKPTTFANLFFEIRSQLCRPPRLFSVPPYLLAGMAGIFGKHAFAQKITGNFILDDSGIRTGLDWHPPFAFEVALRKTIDWYLSVKMAP